MPRSAESSNQEQVEALSPFHAVIIFLITTLGGYLQFQYQSRNLSLFDEHGNIMSDIYVFLFMYALGLMAEFKLQGQLSYLGIIKRFTPLIGILVVVLLLIILLPLLGLIAFFMWTMYTMGEVSKSFREIFQDIFSRINETIRRILGIQENHSPGNEENDSTVLSEVELATQEISNA